MVYKSTNITGGAPPSGGRLEYTSRVAVENQPMASWEVPEVNKGFNGKIIELKEARNVMSWSVTPIGISQIDPAVIIVVDYWGGGRIVWIMAVLYGMYRCIGKRMRNQWMERGVPMMDQGSGVGK